MSKQYLFLVPGSSYNTWQVATRDGKVVITDGTIVYGDQPFIEVGDIFLNTVPHEDILDGLPNEDE